MVWPHLKILGHGEDNSAGDSERSKKERKTEEEMGTSRNGQEWSLEIPWGQCKTRKGGKVLLQRQSRVIPLISINFVKISLFQKSWGKFQTID